ncbi:MAG: hypothetical protein KJ804_01445 [Proteobacteria bacterium]|nr:hypothetical protein [Pseudomonadota bacterium]
MQSPLRIITDTDRNLENLQATIDSLAGELSNYSGKHLLVKAKIYESLARLIRTKEELQAKRDKLNSVSIDKIASYLARKGSITRKTLLKSGCFQGGVKVLDETLNVLDELGMLKTTISKNKQDIVYEFIESVPQIIEQEEK